MILPIVKYGHPALRRKGARIETIDDHVRGFIDDLIETMHKAEGIGLAAQQVGRAWQVTVIDVRPVEDRPSTLEIDGRSAPVESIMPLVLINPEIHPTGQPVTGPEGCLSFPDMYADITRPEAVEVRALDAQGRSLAFKAGGLLSRAIQHEVDHLNGILFIDRMTPASRQEWQEQLDALQAKTIAELEKSSAASRR